MGADSGALGRASRLRAWLGRGPLLRGGAGADATLQRRRSRSDVRRLLNGDMEIALSAGAPPNPLADSRTQRSPRSSGTSPTAPSPIAPSACLASTPASPGAPSPTRPRTPYAGRMWWPLGQVRFVLQAGVS